MSEQTPRFGMPYPSKFDKDWFAVFQALMNQLDANIFGLHDGRNVFVAGGGTLEWQATTSTLTWSADLQFVSPTFGKRASVASGSIVVADGEFVWVSLAPGLTGDTTASLEASAQIPVVVGNMSFAYRAGTTLFFVQGLVLQDTESGPLGATQP